jgi:hypothetical protein
MTISANEFKQRLPQLCLTFSANELPRRQRDKHIIFKSLTFYFHPGRNYSETEVNSLIDSWSELVGRTIKIDRVTLRRSLIDERYLTRSADGSSYTRAIGGGPQGMFESNVDSVDPAATIIDAVRDIEERRRKFRNDVR